MYYNRLHVIATGASQNLNTKIRTFTNGGPLSRISVFFGIIGGFMCRLTKLLLKAVLVLFSCKSSILPFIRALLSLREFFTHQSLNGPPFGTVTYYILGDTVLLKISSSKAFPYKSYVVCRISYVVCRISYIAFLSWPRHR